MRDPQDFGPWRDRNIAHHSRPRTYRPYYRRPYRSFDDRYQSGWYGRNPFGGRYKRVINRHSQTPGIQMVSVSSQTNDICCFNNEPNLISFDDNGQTDRHSVLIRINTQPIPQPHDIDETNHQHTSTSTSTPIDSSNDLQIPSLSTGTLPQIPSDNHFPSGSVHSDEELFSQMDKDNEIIPQQHLSDEEWCRLMDIP